MSATISVTAGCRNFPPQPSFADVIRAAYGRGAAKAAARAANRSHRTTEDWIAGRRQPSADDVLAMMARCPRIKEAVIAEVARIEQERAAR